MINQNNYKDFSVQDFICDEFFQDWVMRPDDEKNSFWKKWQEQNPNKRQDIITAQALLKNIAFVERIPSKAKVQDSLVRTLRDIEAIEESKRRPVALMRRINRLWRAAAILILIIGSALLFYLYVGSDDSFAVETHYGELDTFSLPDKSVVVLNANSKIEYSKRWDKKTAREVWLKGEAFFNIKHIDNDRNIEPHERFLVHVQNATIEVLGTSFNVRQRRGKTEVVLQDGRIKVSFVNSTKPEVIMEPGQMLRIDPQQKESVTIQVTRPEDHSSWMKKRLVLSNPTLEEVIEYLEDVYGKQILLSDPGMAMRRIEGPILLDSLDDALFVLSTVLNVEVIKNDNKIILKPK